MADKNGGTFMDFKEIIEKINYLYNKSVKEGLTKEEKIEQQELRQKYLENFRKNFKEQLEEVKKAPKCSMKN